MDFTTLYILLFVRIHKTVYKKPDCFGSNEPHNDALLVVVGWAFSPTITGNTRSGSTFSLNPTIRFIFHTEFCLFSATP